MLWIAECRVRIAEERGKAKGIEHHDNYSVVRFSSSRRNKEKEGYIHSNWAFARFVGKAHEYLMENVSEGDVIVLKKSGIQNERWKDKDGIDRFPKSPQIVVFEIELYRKSGKGKNESDMAEESDNPFGSEEE